MNKERGETDREDQSGQLPEVPLKPLVDLLRRIVQSPPWLGELTSAKEDEDNVIERWVCKETESLLEWLQLVEKASEAIQAVARFKVRNLPKRENSEPDAR